MKLYLRASAYSVFLHAIVGFGAFLYSQSSESPRIISAEYLTVTTVNIISENLAAQTASASDGLSPSFNPSTETPVKPVHQDIEKIEESAPLKIIAGQRKIKQWSKTTLDNKEADTENEQKIAEAVPTVEPDDRTPQSPNLAGKAELSSATVSNGPGKEKVTGGSDDPAVPGNNKRLPDLNGQGVTHDLMSSPKNIYFQRNYEYIRKIIARNISFPASARKRRLCGKIEVSFLVGTEGSVADIRIISSSGHALLDRNVVEAVRRSAPFPASPELARIVLPIVFRLK